MRSLSGAASFEAVVRCAWDSGIAERAHRRASEELNAKKPTTVAEFVHGFGGNRVIERVLIANNGIAAVKCIRSIRRWAYEVFGNEHAIQVRPSTPAHMLTESTVRRHGDAGGHEGQRGVHPPRRPPRRRARQCTARRGGTGLMWCAGGTNNNNFANVDLIVDIARRMQVEAVWAGWGHASENPKLPESLAFAARPPHLTLNRFSKCNIAFMGPPASAMRALGDKISSCIVAQSVNVPTMAWNGSALTVSAESSRTAPVHRTISLTAAASKTASRR